MLSQSLVTRKLDGHGLSQLVAIPAYAVDLHSLRYHVMRVHKSTASIFRMNDEVHRRRTGVVEQMPLAQQQHDSLAFLINAQIRLVDQALHRAHPVRNGHDPKLRSYYM